jgi:hypothetical protein
MPIAPARCSRLCGFLVVVDISVFDFGLLLVLITALSKFVDAGVIDFVFVGLVKVYEEDAGRDISISYEGRGWGDLHIIAEGGEAMESGHFNGECEEVVL